MTSDQNTRDETAELSAKLALTTIDSLRKELAETKELNEAMAQELSELREIERKRVSEQDFKTASQVPSPKTAYVHKVDFNSFCMVVLGINLNLSSGNGKVLFDLTDDGQLKNPRPE